MNIINLTTYTHYIFIGDMHGLGMIKTFLEYDVDKKGIEDNTVMFFCGDIGAGFGTKESEKTILHECNKIAVKHNYHIILVRGNHDNPNLFCTDSPFNESNITFVEDFSIVKTFDKNILCVGGSISLDRINRTLNKSYWENEGVPYISRYMENYIKTCEFNIDIICSHTTPTYIKPVNNSVYEQGPIVAACAQYDKKLLQDNWDDRYKMNTLYDFISQYHNIEYWIYGHFHDHFYTEYNETRFVGLDMYYLLPKFIKKLDANMSIYKAGADIYDLHEEAKYNNTFIVT